MVALRHQLLQHQLADNRSERRKDAAIMRASLNSAKSRCLACDRAGRPRNREHFWPRWLIEFCEATEEPVNWLGKRVAASAVQIPLCVECNSAFGNELETPMSALLPRISGGDGMSDLDCELLVRWLWKFEGLGWGIYYFHDSMQYSSMYTLRQRVLNKDSLNGIRGELVVCVALAHKNNPGLHDWSLGISSGVGKHDAIFIAAVFRNVAMMVTLAHFAHLVPPMFARYQLRTVPSALDVKVLQPQVVFPLVSDAEIVTREASMFLKFAHEQHAEEQDRLGLRISKRRVEIPHPVLRKQS